MNEKILTLFFSFLVFYGYTQENKCDYFGLMKPGISPKNFDPKILNINQQFKFNVEISQCDEVYFTSIDSSENIYVTVKKNGQWSKPKRASFSHPKYNDADPFLTKDGLLMYFISKRPTEVNDKKLDFNIWVSRRIGSDWSEPQPLPKPINTDQYNEYFFSISDQGNAFFSSNRKGGYGSFDIYTTKVLDNNQFTEPKNMGSPVSSSKYEFDPYISKDEQFLVYSVNENDGSNLYVSFKGKNGQWMEPKKLGKEINTTRQDFAPSISADGQFLFYSNNGRLKWVSIDILKAARR